MLWDPNDETSIKVPKRPANIHTTEVLSAFGWTDTTDKPNDGGIEAGSSPNTNSPPAVVHHKSSAKYTLEPTTPLSQSTCGEDSLRHQELESHQKKLPLLPIPALKDTAKLYLSSLEGLLNAEEYENSRAIVEDFIEPNGVGENLQELLERHAAKPDVGASWIESFWDDAYLCGRDPIPINVNYFFGFEDHQDATKMTQVGRAASLLHAAADIHVLIRDQRLSVDTERGAPLCMSQYRRVFSASRVPGEKRDSIVTYTTSAPCTDETISHTSLQHAYLSRHCIVLARNRMFKFNILDDTEGANPLPLEEILRRIAFIHVVAHKSKDKVGAPVGVFTTMNRDDWYETQLLLKELEPSNDQNLFDIQSAILVVALDPTISENVTEAARLYLHGTGTNRWFDRHNLIITENGCAGINFEHSVGDGATTLRVADMMYRADAKACPSADAVAEAIAKWEKELAGASSGKLESCTELKWTLDGSLDTLMKSAFDDYVNLINSNETIALNFTQFGGNWIKKAKFSPDAFVQLAFQLTYSRLFGRCDATYEAASTRSFLHGRTEVVRSVSRAATDFCQSASQPVFSRRINSKVPSTYQLMKDAAEDHVAYMRKAKSGLGVDRHLLGMRLVCMMNGLPLHPIFTDAAYSRSSHWNLSTSHCGSSALNLFGFGPVVADGVGLGYMIKNDEIAVVVTSKYTHKLMSSTIFASMLESSLLHMRALCESQPEQRKEAKPQALNFTHPTGVPDFEYNDRSGFSYRAQSRSLYTMGEASASNLGRSVALGSALNVRSSQSRTKTLLDEKRGTPSPAQTPTSGQVAVFNNNESIVL